MVIEIANKLRALKGMEGYPGVAGIKSVSLDTAQNYLVEYRGGGSDTFQKEEVEADIEKFVLKLAQHVNQTGQVDVSESSGVGDVQSSGEVVPGDEADVVESENGGRE